jgi:hypothetical protein
MSGRIVIFKSGRETSLANYYTDVLCWQQLAYHADISNQLNDISLVAEDRSITVLTAEDKVVKSD